jgi:hypothetical protein
MRTCVRSFGARAVKEDEQKGETKGLGEATGAARRKWWVVGGGWWGVTRNAAASGSLVWKMPILGQIWANADSFCQFILAACISCSSLTNFSMCAHDGLTRPHRDGVTAKSDYFHGDAMSMCGNERGREGPRLEEKNEEKNGKRREGEELLSTDVEGSQLSQTP